MNARPDSFADAFFFGVETLATVGCSRARELRLERAHILSLQFFGHSYMCSTIEARCPAMIWERVIAADARVFLTLEAHDATLAAVVHDSRYDVRGDIRFGRRYADVDNARPRRGKPMPERMKPVWYKILLYPIFVGLALTLSACTDLKKNFLCRPDGVCVNAPDGGHGIGP